MANNCGDMAGRERVGNRRELFRLPCVITGSPLPLLEIRVERPPLLNLPMQDRSIEDIEPISEI